MQWRYMPGLRVWTKKRISRIPFSQFDVFKLIIITIKNYETSMIKFSLNHTLGNENFISGKFYLAKKQ